MTLSVRFLTNPISFPCAAAEGGSLLAVYQVTHHLQQSYEITNWTSSVFTVALLLRAWAINSYWLLFFFPLPYFGVQGWVSVRRSLLPPQSPALFTHKKIAFKTAKYSTVEQLQVIICISCIIFSWKYAQSFIIIWFCALSYNYGG